MFAVTVRANRRRLGLTQEELAVSAGLSVRSIRKIEAGQVSSPRPATVRLLADAFGLAGIDRERFCQTAAGEPDTPPAQPNVPMQLPADVSAFTGREEQLAYMDALLAGASDQPNAVIVSALSGTAGVGKTALAVHWAHQIRDRFPDGQLFVDLHGHTHGVAPVEPGEALDRILRALGVPGEQIPADVDDRAALYRSRLAGEQVLIMLEDAAAEDQVTPLLPGIPGCLVLVTSRRRLAGLHHAHTVSLDALPLADAVTLFAGTTGGQRLASEPPQLLVEAVQLCDRLPLAICIAAARLRTHPSWPLAHLVRRLRDHHHRLTELAAGHRSVAAALDLSYLQLTSDQQRLYRLLGLHPGMDIDTFAASALAGSTLGHVSRLLDELLDAHLLEEPVPGRHMFHDLVHAHATQTATAVEPEPVRRAALSRLLDYYRHAAAMAMDTAYRYERDLRPKVPYADTPTPDLHDPASALAWLDAELPNLLAAARHATNQSCTEHTWHLSATLERYLRDRGRYHDAENLHHQARTAGHRDGALYALLGLGWIDYLKGRHEQAAEQRRQALHLARTTANPASEVAALTGLGDVHLTLGRHQQAIDHYQQALTIAHSVSTSAGAPSALSGLGAVHLMQGRYRQAVDHYQQALTTAHSVDSRTCELVALTGLGHVYVMLGRYRQAVDHYQQALTTAHSVGNPAGKLAALRGLGWSHLMQGGHQQAADHYRQLLEGAQEIGSHNWQFEAYHGLGRVHHANGNPETALVHHRQALELAADLRQPVDQAQAHDGLAHAYHALGQPEQARRHWQRALTILTSIGADYTEDPKATTSAIRGNLDRLDQP
jgi:tetratricopeptide (TPR) repeat protein/transcriptional regulator with XRE-family HTH domain